MSVQYHDLDLFERLIEAFFSREEADIMRFQLERYIVYDENERQMCRLRKAKQRENSIIHTVVCSPHLNASRRE